jgi:uncharacterized protein (DUF983 family)
MRIDSPTQHASELQLSRAARLFGRALRLRCPRCGTRGIFASWTRLKDDCPGCGMPLERKESDYFIGAYLMNLIAVELLLFIGLATVVITTSPNTPWDVLEWAGPLLMFAGAVLCYPFAKATWLALDLLLRPLSDDEVADASRRSSPGRTP